MVMYIDVIMRNLGYLSSWLSEHFCLLPAASLGNGGGCHCTTSCLLFAVFGLVVCEGSWYMYMYVVHAW